MSEQDLTRHWCYQEKDAWHAFTDEHPSVANAIRDLLMHAWIPRNGTADPILASGAQVEVLALRLACLLGQTTYSWDDDPYWAPLLGRGETDG